VEALRLPAETTLKLRRLGLKTVASLKDIPQRSLVIRFGSEFLYRLDQVFSRRNEPLTPWRPAPEYRAVRVSGEPILTTSAVDFVLDELLKEVCMQLEKNHLGSRYAMLECYRLDGSVDRCEIRTSKPSRSSAHLRRLFSDELEHLNAEFGFETFVLSVLAVEALYPSQLTLSSDDSAQDEDAFDALIDRLGMKLGFQEVNQIRIRESYLPEHAVEFCPVTVSRSESAKWPEYRVRPIRLIHPPMPIQVSILIPGALPVQILIGQHARRIVRMEGPERLHTEWWRDPGGNFHERDYYRIEDDKGCRLWIFHDSSDRWYLHGHLA
jgi:protein ImuB